MKHARAACCADDAPHADLPRTACAAPARRWYASLASGLQLALIALALLWVIPAWASDMAPASPPDGPANGVSGDTPPPRPAPAFASAPDAFQASDCRPRITSLRVAPETPAVNGSTLSPPAQGWQPVTLPDIWTDRWPEHSKAVWYRIDWELPCDPAQAPVAMATQGFSLAGEVFSNHDLLWRDTHLTDPMSRSWNMPRYWILPASSLQRGSNTIWLRTHSVPHISPGLWDTRLGPPAEIHAWYIERDWLQRKVPLLNITITGVLGLIFLFFWLLRRREGAAGWFATMSLAWIVFMSNFLITSPWPLPNSYAIIRVVTSAFLLYVCAFCLFTWRFASLRLRKGEPLLWGITAIAILTLAFVPTHLLARTTVWSAGLYGSLFVVNCLSFQRVAWRSNDPSMRLMAVCLLSFIPIGLLDFLSMVRLISMPFSLTPWSAPITAMMMAFILAWRFARHQNQIERFNQDLAVTVTRTRDELTRTLQSRHSLALRNARLEERLQIAHDLHDGMGSTLIRTIAQVEHTQAPPDARHMLSALKSMRDDLRQIIDSGTSDSNAAIETPAQWLAPLRHRFVRLLDTLDMASEWRVPDTWPVTPSAAQCLALTRFVEEAMTNVIKHAAARQVSLRISHSPDGAGMLLCIEDDGVGFDLDAVLNAGLSVGIHSMRRRIARIGGTLHMTSQPGKTLLCVHLAAPAAPATAPAVA